MAMKITTPSFEHQGEIPKQSTCDGSDFSPALNWSNLPENTKSLALIVDDPDAPDPTAPKMTWVHWVLFNLPPEITGLAENIDPSALPKGTLQGLNDWQQTGYRGPCPPRGRHRYFFKLYALDTIQPDLQTPDKANLEKAMASHVIGKAELIGTYQH